MENHGITDCLGEAMQIQVKRSFMLKSIYFIPWGHLGPTLNQKRAHTLECNTISAGSKFQQSSPKGPLLCGS